MTIKLLNAGAAGYANQDLRVSWTVSLKKPLPKAIDDWAADDVRASCSFVVAQRGMVKTTGHAGAALLSH